MGDDMVEVNIKYSGEEFTVRTAAHALALERRLDEILPKVQRKKLISGGKTLCLSEKEVLVDGMSILLLGSTEDIVSKPSSLPRVKNGDMRLSGGADVERSVVPIGFKKAPLKASSRERAPEYGFKSIETLNYAFIRDHQRARDILEELSSDQGILNMMAARKWKVGCLSEMMPEGKVGVSEVCVLGLNEMKGMRIRLRIRTDDLLGFRKMLSIREVLFHELAHNVYSGHGDDFYMLMRQITKESNEMNWMKSQGRVLSSSIIKERDEDTINGAYVLVKDRYAYEGGVGKIGGNKQPHSDLSSKEAAARAALARAFQQEGKVDTVKEQRDAEDETTT